ncbi:MAG: hypothetical protein H6R10_780 [Rhodocyclaceae bacterium]|nr:hypothetical protein [Rhodocyclaceae bacterium]
MSIRRRIIGVLALGAGAWALAGPAWAGIRPQPPAAAERSFAIPPRLHSENHPLVLAQWAVLPPDQRQQMRQQMREHWQQMPPAQQQERRQEYRDQFQQMPQEERQRIREEMRQRGGGNGQHRGYGGHR